MLLRPSACLILAALCCFLIPVAGIKITTLDREVRKPFFTGQCQLKFSSFDVKYARNIVQVAVTQQLIVVTETYKFHNDDKNSADELLLCSTNEFAAAQAYQEV